MVVDAISGNRESFSELMELADNLVEKYLRDKINNKDDLLDLKQRILTYIVRYINENKINDPKAFMGYLIQIIKNNIKSYYRDKNAHERNFPSYSLLDKKENIPTLFRKNKRFLDALPDESTTTLNNLINKENKQRFYQALDSLSEMEQKIIKLELNGNGNVSQIARSLGINVGFIHSIRAKAIKKLKKILN